jgi:multicomponent K+:H+ antiporter subunit E
MQGGIVLSGLVPHPLLSLLLFAIWPMLAESASAGHLLLAGLLALAIPLAFRRWLGERPLHLRRPGRMLRLAAVVLYDIVRSNFEVTRRVLGPESAIRPAFVRVPLALTDPRAIGTLAAIITMTPGTLTADVAPDGSYLTVHALHVDDADALVASIRDRYERPLLEIFR